MTIGVCAALFGLLLAAASAETWSTAELDGAADPVYQAEQQALEDARREAGAITTRRKARESRLEQEAAVAKKAQAVELSRRLEHDAVEKQQTRRAKKVGSLDAFEQFQADTEQGAVQHAEVEEILKAKQHASEEIEMGEAMEAPAPASAPAPAPKSPTAPPTSAPTQSEKEREADRKQKEAKEEEKKQDEKPNGGSSPSPPPTAQTDDPTPAPTNKPASFGGNTVGSNDMTVKIPLN